MVSKALEITNSRHQLTLHELDPNLKQLVFFENSKIDLWLSPKKEITKKLYEKVVREFFTFNDTKLLRDITSQDINNFLYNYLEGLDLSTIRLYRSALSSLYSELQKIGYVKINPVSLTTAIKHQLSL